MLKYQKEGGGSWGILAGRGPNAHPRPPDPPIISLQFKKKVFACFMMQSKLMFFLFVFVCICLKTII